MDLVLGVSVTDGIALLAVVGGAAADGAVLGQLAQPLTTTDPAENAAELAKLIFGARAVQALQGHRLMGIGLCWDDEAAAALTEAHLKRMGITSVAVVERRVAAARVVSASSRGAGRVAGQPSGLLLLTPEAATLFLVDGESIDTVAAASLGRHAASVCALLIGHLAPNTVDRIYLIGDDPDLVAQAERLRGVTAVPLVVSEHADFAAAIGAARTVPSVVDAPAPETDATAALRALIAASAKRAQALPTSTTRLGPGKQPLNRYATTRGEAPRYSDYVVVLHRQPPKPKVEAAKINADVGVASRPTATRKGPRAPKNLPSPAGRWRRQIFVGSGLSALVVAGVAAVAITTAVEVQPAAESSVDVTQAPSSVATVPEAVDARQQVIQEAQVAVPPTEVVVEQPAPEEVIEPVAVETAPEPEVIVPDPAEVAPVTEPVSEVVTEEPVIADPVPAPEGVENLPPAVVADTEHIPNGAPPGPGSDVAVPDPALPLPTDPQLLPPPVG